MAYIFLIWSIINWIFQVYILFPTIGGQPPSINALLLAWYVPFSTLWFVWALAIYTVLTKLMNDLRIPSLILALISFYASLYFIDEMPDSQSAILRYLLFFQIGAWYRSEILNSQERFQFMWIAYAITFLACGAAITQFEAGSIVYSILRLVMSFAGIGVAFRICQVASRIAPIKSAFVFLGQRTLPIYVLHSILIWPVIITFANTATSFSTFTVIAILLTFSAILAPLCVFVAHVLHRLGFGWLFNEPRFSGVAQRQS